MIAEVNRVTLITAAFCHEDVEKAVAADPALAGRVTVRSPAHRWWHFRPSGIWRMIMNSPLKPAMNLAYQRWLGDAKALAEVLAREQNFDLVHLVTFVGFRFPGRFYQLGVPFVWGPIGGLENTPWRFLPAMGPRGAAFFAVRNIVNTLQKKFLPGPKRAMKAAGSRGRGELIAATAGIQQEIERWYGEKSEVICEIGPPEGAAERAAKPSKRQPGEPLRLVWSGQHLPGKALPLLLKALAKLSADLNWELTILGEGPCTKKWQKLARRLGVAERCEWVGKLPRDEAVHRMGQAHLFCITSLKDLTSTVLLEALSLGVPVVCPDHCGFTNVVTEDCGIKLPLHRPKQLIADLAQSIDRLGRDEHERRRLAAGALARSRDFDWDKKAQQLEAIYRRKLRQHGTNTDIDDPMGSAIQAADQRDSTVALNDMISGDSA
jgi:glycosyltransferase involved in cell wall biosynthesis